MTDERPSPVPLLNLHDLTAWCQTQRTQDTERGRASNDADESSYRHGRASGFDLAALVISEQAVARDDDDYRPGLEAALNVLEQHRDSAQVVEQPDRRQAGVVDALTEAADQVRRVVGRYPDTLRELVATAQLFSEEARAGADGPAGVRTDAEQQYLSGVAHAWAALADCVTTVLNRRTDDADRLYPYEAVLSSLTATAQTTVMSRVAAMLPAEERRGWRDTLNQASALVADVRDRELGAPADPAPEPVPASPWDAYPKVLPPDHPVGSFHELALFLGGDADSFTGDLLRLIAKADPINLNKLGEGFGMEVAAFLMWRAVAPIEAGRLAQLLRITSDLPRRYTK